MLPELLMRDFVLHRRALLGAALTVVLVLAAWTLGSWDSMDWVDGAAGILALELFLVAILPAGLHLRETLQGTLGDLLVLPVQRRDLVALRFLEGFLACAGVLVLFLAVVLVKGHPSPRVLGRILGSPFLVWIPAMVLAYSLPFALRGRLRTAQWGMAVPMALIPLGGLAHVFGTERLARTADRVLQRLSDLHGHAAGALLLDGAIPLLLLAASFALSLRVIERAEP
jgi:hypothetical protein